jgi:hypothetical protein
VSVLRSQLFAQYVAVKEPEKKIFFEQEAKRALSIEKLFLSLALMATLSTDLDQMSEQLEEIVELKECLKNLKIGVETNRKK